MTSEDLCCLDTNPQTLGTLTCTVECLAMLRGLDAEEDDTAPDEGGKKKSVLSLSGGKGAAVVATALSGVPSVRVALSAVMLAESGATLPAADKGKGAAPDAKPQKVTHVRVEIDMLATDKENLRTAPSKLGAKATAPLTFERDYLAGPESKLALTYVDCHS